MSEPAGFSKLNALLVSAGESFRYPLTPDLAAQAMQRQAARWRPRLAWVLAALILALVTLLAVPEVRARVLEFLQIGAIRILLPVSTETLPAGGALPPTATFSPREVLNSVLDLDGETSLERARLTAGFEVGLPSYPSDLGEPDKVYLQSAGSGKYVVLAWLDEEKRADLVLYIVGSGVTITKGPPDVIETTEVNGTLAVWARGDYLVIIDGDRRPARFVHGPALIWEANGLTYRLEAQLPLDEMVKIAESISEDG